MMIYIQLHAPIIVRSIIIFVLGFILAIMVRRKLQKLLDAHFNHRINTLIISVIFYGMMVLLGVSILHDFGFHLSGFLGAAGILGIVIGFAAQTSISNIISGLFLFIDDTIGLGDTISVAGNTGIVESISLLSIKLRSSDNKLIRLSHEFLLKNAVVNLSYYDQRRLDFSLVVPLSVPFETVKTMIMQAIENDAELLKTPAPNSTISYIGTSTYTIVVKAWANQSQLKQASEKFIQSLEQQAVALNITLGITLLN